MVQKQCQYTEHHRKQIRAFGLSAVVGRERICRSIDSYTINIINYTELIVIMYIHTLMHSTREMHM
jgi:hypothetical protein